MRIGFKKVQITPPVGTELGGYAGYRPCTGVHDDLFCRAVVLEQEGKRYGLAVLDLMCADEGLCQAVVERVKDLGIESHRLILAAIHTHAAPTGMIPGAGPLAGINGPEEPKNPEFMDYIRSVVEKTAWALAGAAENLEHFQIRSGRCPAPVIGSERHTGATAKGDLTAVQIRTDSGKTMILYNLPCHPTVLNAQNTLVSRDFAAGIEELLGADMAVFLNGAAGDISTRFTRRASSFEECDRMGRVAAEAVRDLLETAVYQGPQPLKGIHRRVTLEARQVETEEKALEVLAMTQEKVRQAQAAGEEPGALRILQSYVEGAGVSLQFARTMAGIRTLDLPVTVFRMGELEFATIPGELFSTLAPEGMGIIAYANGYYRYIADRGAYDAGYYEAMAAILARGQGEKLLAEIENMRKELA